MPLELVPAEPVDAPRIVVLERLAWAGNPFTSQLFPGPFPEDFLEFQASRMAWQMSAGPAARAWKVVDTEISADGAAAEHIIAFAMWNIFETPPPTLQPGNYFGPGTNLDACRAVFNGKLERRERLMGGKPYVCECR